MFVSELMITMPAEEAQNFPLLRKQEYVDMGGSERCRWQMNRWAGWMQQKIVHSSESVSYLGKVLYGNEAPILSHLQCQCGEAGRVGEAGLFHTAG